MTLPDEIRRELFDLCWTLQDGSFMPADVERLERLAEQHTEVHALYAKYMVMCGALQWERKTNEADAGYTNLSSGSNPQSLIPDPSFIPPLVIDPTPTSQSMLGSFLFSHMAAAVILGIGLLIGLAWRISLPVEGNSSPQTPNIALSVGRITELADCKWSRVESGVRDPGSGISDHQALIHLGDCFLVSDGLMEITYDSGAKVILQGPCTYMVESKRGGYLAVGKLTALVEKGSGAKGPGPGNANHSPLFAVRTPTAIVTDLGTEFGVEVEASGATHSHVFQGSVSIVPSHNGRGVRGEGARASADILHAGESARVERGRNNKVAITRELGQPDRFIRQIPSSFIPHPSSLGNRPQNLIPNPSYRLTDLGTLGGPLSRALAINAAGQVVGDSINAEGLTHAFFYDKGKMIDLGTLEAKTSCAHGINATGQIVGISGDQWDDMRAFLYSNGAMKDIGTLGGRGARAFAINDAGQIVGQSLNTDGISHAFLYTPGKGMKDLGALGGPKLQSIATGINAEGMVAGYSQTQNSPLRAFLYIPAKGMIDLGKLEGNPKVAFRVNDAGQVIGVSTINNATHGFIYSLNSGIKYLGALHIASDYILHINNRGQIICGAEGRDARGVCRHSFLYHNGKMIDLISLIRPATDWTDLYAMAINDSGQIVGVGNAPNGGVQAFLLTPVKEKNP